MSISAMQLNKLAKEKTKLLQDLFAMEPLHVEVKDPKTKQPLPHTQGEDVIYLWDKLYACDPVMKSIVVETVTGPSTPGKDYYDDPKNANPAMPYQQLRALVGDGGFWKWPEIWKNLDILPRRGPAWRHIDDPTNLGKIQNPNPHIVPLNCLVIGCGPVGCRLAIELALGGHRVTIWEKRRQIIDPDTGLFEAVGFTNRVNRPHINNFCRNDLDRLNGRNFMTPKMCYPVFTNDHTSSIGIDECQMLLMKTALLIGVEIRLGVGYEKADVDIENEKNQRPSWMIEYTADSIAQTRYKMKSKGQQRFDALFGVDGGQSKVRVTQTDYLGTPRIKCFKKMFGIVSNLQKVSKTKLKEMGYGHGLEPDDLSGGVTGIFFYKASYHNYFLVHPEADEMERNGIPWQGCFSFNKARGQKNPEKDALKEKLKKFMTKKARELNIPLDETLSNDGFVNAPNDVMSFDFSEFYHAEKSAAVNVPPLEWNADVDGEWEVPVPLVALAGDAVADPNWILGVGLQRGWTSALDATFYADNLYNNKTFIGRPFDETEQHDLPVEWSQHMDNMANLIMKVSNASREGKLSPEMGTGMLDEKGPVVKQISKVLKAKNQDFVPQYQCQVEPWGRYKEYKLELDKMYSGKALFDKTHPLAVRELAIYEHNARWVDQGDRIKKKGARPTAAMLTWPKRFECSAFWGMMNLLEIEGKAPPGVKPAAGGSAAPAEPEPEPEPEPSRGKSPVRPKLDASEVKQSANRVSINIRENALAAMMKGKGGMDNIVSSPLRKVNKLGSSPWNKKSGGDDEDAAPRGRITRQSLTVPQLNLGSSTRGGRFDDDDDDVQTSTASRGKMDMAAQMGLAVKMAGLKSGVGGGGGGGGADGPLGEAQKIAIKNELEVVRRKLAVAELEVELLRKTLKAYQNAEAAMD
jgi:hypothetical protein